MYKNIFILFIITVFASGYTYSAAKKTGNYKIEISQDSTSPRKGTVKVKELSTSGKKKKRKKKEPTKEQIELDKTKAWMKMKTDQGKALRKKERLASKTKQARKTKNGKT